MTHSFSSIYWPRQDVSHNALDNKWTYSPPVLNRTNKQNHITRIPALLIQKNLCKTATQKKNQKLVFKISYRLMQGEHSAILSTFIKLPFVIKICFVYFWVAVLHRFYCTFTMVNVLKNLIIFWPCFRQNFWLTGVWVIFCQTVNALIGLHIGAVWSGPSVCLSLLCQVKSFKNVYCSYAVIKLF